MRKLPGMIEKNLSRLASQWSGSVNAALEKINDEAERRLDDFIATITGFLESSRSDSDELRSNLERITAARESIRETSSLRAV